MAKKPAAAAKKASAKTPDTSASTLVVRSRELLRSKPGILGYSNLIVPDEAFGNSKFKASLHMNAAAASATFEEINEAYWALIPEIKDQAKEKKVDGKLKILSKADLLNYLSEKLKDANDSAPSQDKFFTFDCNSHYHDRKTDSDVAITIKAWDTHGAPLDLKAAKVGKGSVVQALFTVGVWAGSSPFSKWVALPTLRFAGLQILKLEQWKGSGGSSKVNEVADADLAYLDENFQASDLSLFLKKDGKPDSAPAGDEMDDEIPF